MQDLTRCVLRMVLFVVAAAGCGGDEQSRLDPLGSGQANSKPLSIRALRGTVIRMGSLRRPREPLYGVRLRALVCGRSTAAADRTYPTFYRVTHHITPGRAARVWEKPFRVMENELHWLVPLGETTDDPCREVEFEDVIPPSNYGGLESPLGLMGYTRIHRCYGIRLTLKVVVFRRTNRRPPERASASKRTIVQCGRFRRPR